MVKVTFTLDDETVAQIRRAAGRLGKAQSHIVREAVAEYAARADRLSEAERLRLLGVLEDIGRGAPTRSAKAVDGELAAVRSARRAGGRRSEVIVHIDTSALVDALTGPRRALPRLTTLVEQGHPLALSSLVYYEWKRGPRTRGELAAQEALLPTEAVVAFGGPAAALAADLYRRVPRPGGREVDLAIAAVALIEGAALWTLNPGDFKDVPGLALV